MAKKETDYPARIACAVSDRLKADLVEFQVRNEMRNLPTAIRMLLSWALLEAKERERYCDFGGYCDHHLQSGF